MRTFLAESEFELIQMFHCKVTSVNRKLIYFQKFRHLWFAGFDWVKLKVLFNERAQWRTLPHSTERQSAHTKLIPVTITIFSVGFDLGLWEGMRGPIMFEH